MNNKDWEIIKLLYEEKSIKNVAIKQFLTQPAVTYRIKQIEEYLETKIIIRGRKGVEFTQQGMYLVRYAKKMLFELNKLKQNIQKVDNEVKGILRIGVASNFARYKLPNILKAFREQYPKVEFKLITGWSSEIIPLLQDGEVHLAIIRGEYNWSGEKILLHQENVSIVSRHFFDLNKLPHIGRIHYKTDSFLSKTIADWWQSRFIYPPKITMEVDHISTCIEMVKNGLGYGIFPDISLDLFNNEIKHHIIKLTDNNNQIIERNSWLLYRQESLELTIVKVFVDHITKYI